MKVSFNISIENGRANLSEMEKLKLRKIFDSSQITALDIMQDMHADISSYYNDLLEEHMDRQPFDSELSHQKPLINTKEM